MQPHSCGRPRFPAASFDSSVHLPRGLVPPRWRGSMRFGAVQQSGTCRPAVLDVLFTLRGFRSPPPCLLLLRTRSNSNLFQSGVPRLVRASPSGNAAGEALVASCRCHGTGRIRMPIALRLNRRSGRLDPRRARLAPSSPYGTRQASTTGPDRPTANRRRFYLLDKTSLTEFFGREAVLLNASPNLEGGAPRLTRRRYSSSPGFFWEIARPAMPLDAKSLTGSRCARESPIPHYPRAPSTFLGETP
jgi:hypothetical protein